MTYKDPKTLAALKAQGLSDEAISRQFGITEPAIRYFRHKFNIPRNPNTGNWHRRYSLNSRFFETIDTPDKAYILGLIAADGYISKNGRIVAIYLISSDAPLLQSVLDCVGSNAPIHTKCREGWHKHPMSYIHLCSKQLVQDLASYNIGPAKSLTLTYPSSIPRDLHRDFIRGLWDGDGWIGKRQFSLVGTKALLTAVLEIIEELTGHRGRFKPFPKGQCYEIQFSRSDASVLRCLYQDSILYLERKYQRFLTYWV